MFFINLLLFYAYSHIYWWLGDRKSLKIFCTIHNILADPNNAKVCTVSNLPQISNSSNLDIGIFDSIPNAPPVISMIITFIFHNLKSSLARSWCFFIFPLSFIFTLWSTNTPMSTIWQIIFYLFTIIKSVFFCFYYFNRAINSGIKPPKYSPFLKQSLVCVDIIGINGWMQVICTVPGIWLLLLYHEFISMPLDKLATFSDNFAFSSLSLLKYYLLFFWAL